MSMHKEIPPDETPRPVPRRRATTEDDRARLAATFNGRLAAERVENDDAKRTAIDVVAELCFRELERP